MPDIFRVIAHRWKTALLITFLATVVALVACLISPKEFLGEVTALPSNPEIGDRARIFNQNIQALYRELGAPDELDEIEGTAKLDTIFLAVAKQFRLPAYNPENSDDVLRLHKAAKALQKNTRIHRTGYGELKIKVWDKDPYMAAALANALAQELNSIHQQLRAENNRLVLQRLKESTTTQQDSSAENLSSSTTDNNTSQAALYTRLINEYELALQTNPNALLIVEPARPSPWHDRPQTVLVVVFTFLASLLFSIFLLLLTESRRKNA
jgi:capsular polysaccharide biosynthesis protein